MSEQNKAISRRLIEEGFNKGNLSIVDELLGNNYTAHDVPPDLPRGRDGLKAFIKMQRDAFPDLHSNVEFQIADGDLVATHWTATGTNTGSGFGMGPTNKPMKITGTVIDRIVGGKIVETWNNFDQLGLMQQLGVIPSQPGAQQSRSASQTRSGTGTQAPGTGVRP